jgi:hypothetical protein
MSLDDEQSDSIPPGNSSLAIHCEWDKASSDIEQPASFSLQLPLERAVEALRCVAKSPTYVSGDATSLLPLHVSDQDMYVQRLFTEKAEMLDLNSFAAELMQQTKLDQVTSAFAVIRAALASVLDVPRDNDDLSICLTSLASAQGDDVPMEVDSSSESSNVHNNAHRYNNSFKVICDGLFAATCHKALKEDAMMLLKGIGSHILLIVMAFLLMRWSKKGSKTICPVGKFSHSNHSVASD